MGAPSEPRQLALLEPERAKPLRHVETGPIAAPWLGEAANDNGEPDGQG